MPIGFKLSALLSALSPLRSFTVRRLSRNSAFSFSAFYSPTAFYGPLRSAFIHPKLMLWSGGTKHSHSDAVFNELRGDASLSLPGPANSHSWPEWSKLANLLVEKGHSSGCIASGDDDDSFLGDGELPEEFLKAAEACLGFARKRPDLLRLFSKKNVEVVVLNGSPFLFKNGENSARRMKIFLAGVEGNESQNMKAETVDIMRYLLSYVHGSVSSADGSTLSSSDCNNLKSEEFVERSVRKLLCELFNLAGTIWKPKSVDATSTEFHLDNEQLSGHPWQDTETRSGDSCYPKSPGQLSPVSKNQSNVLSSLTDKAYTENMSSQTQYCEETSLSRIGSRNTSNCEFIANSSQPSASILDQNTEFLSRAGGTADTLNSAYCSTNPSWPNNSNGYNGGPTQLWTSSSSTLNRGMEQSSLSPGNYSKDDSGTSYAGYSMNSTQPTCPIWSNNNTPYGAISTKSPSNSWSNHYGEPTPNSYQPSLNYPGNHNTQYDHAGYISGFTSNSSQPPSGSRNTYRTSHDGFSELPSSSWNDRNTSYSASTAYPPQPPQGSCNKFNGEDDTKSTQPSTNNNRSSNYSSFVGPIMNSSQHPARASNPYTSQSDNNATRYGGGVSADSYSRYPVNSNPLFSNTGTSYTKVYANTTQLSSSENLNSGVPSQSQNTNVSNGYSIKSLEGSCVKEPDPLDMSEEAKAERWFRRAAQIKDISELSQIPDEDFPQIMPMRKGVNRFVVSKRKTPLERRLASQQYKRSLPVASFEPENEPTTGEKGDDDNYSKKNDNYYGGGSYQNGGYHDSYDGGYHDGNKGEYNDGYKGGYNGGSGYDKGYYGGDGGYHGNYGNSGYGSGNGGK